MIKFLVMCYSEFREKLYSFLSCWNVFATLSWSFHALGQRKTHLMLFQSNSTYTGLIQYATKRDKGTYGLLIKNNGVILTSVIGKTRSSLVDRRTARVYATDKARCDLVHMPSVFAKTACQSDSHVVRAVPGWTAWIRWTQENSLPCRLVITEGSPPGSKGNHNEGELNAVVWHWCHSAEMGVVIFSKWCPQLILAHCTVFNYSVLRWIII